MKSFKALVGAAVVAAGLTFGMTPAPAQAQSLVDIARVIVSVNDIAYRGGVPYYRYGQYRPEDRIIVVRERGRNVYYRNAYRNASVRHVPQGNAYGYWAKRGRYQDNRYDYRNNDRRWDRDDDRRSHDRYDDRDDDNRRRRDRRGD